MLYYITIFAFKESKNRNRLNLVKAKDYLYILTVIYIEFKCFELPINTLSWLYQNKCIFNYCVCINNDLIQLYISKYSRLVLNP